MDKWYELTGLIFIGLPVVALTLMVGWIFDDMGKGKSDPDSGNGVYNDSDSGEYSGMDRYIPSSEEIETVLYNLRIGASRHEKEVIDYLIDKEGPHEENN